MIATAAARLTTSGFVQVEFDIDDDGYVTSYNPIMPPIGEVILQIIATGIIFFLLYKFGAPAIKKYYAERTARIQAELDGAAAARSSAEVEATEIRAALGDLGAEQARIEADASAQAEALLADGRARIDAEIAELEARAEAEIASIASRSGDELRGEIARQSARAVDRLVAESLDEGTQQALIEDFITRVGQGANA
jgi:F-type H+-transporting ATPase subunit b